jgi:hypothetical protein
VRRRLGFQVGEPIPWTNGDDDYRDVIDQRVFGRNSILGDDYSWSADGSETERITIEHLLPHTTGGWSKDARDLMF